MKTVTKYPWERINPWLVEIPASAREDMLVPARIYVDDVLWERAIGDRTLEQLVNVATMPGITGFAYAMPDAHEGYGFPVGGVAAFRAEDGVISPGGVGYDINCGVRLLASD
ncbi:MAG TPA: RtcB family protein, partial [Thermoanaerobaculia bacterium]|nr:RtcB family protein [Thermoanaerobaculia bacterium]